MSFFKKINKNGTRVFRYYEMRWPVGALEAVRFLYVFEHAADNDVEILGVSFYDGALIEELNGMHSLSFMCLGTDENLQRFYESVAKDELIEATIQDEGP